MRQRVSCIPTWSSRWAPVIGEMACQPQVLADQPKLFSNPILMNTSLKQTLIRVFKNSKEKGEVKDDKHP
jgi:hypothetical protein